MQKISVQVEIPTFSEAIEAELSYGLGEFAQLKLARECCDEVLKMELSTLICKYKGKILVLKELAYDGFDCLLPTFIIEKHIEDDYKGFTVGFVGLHDWVSNSKEWKFENGSLSKKLNTNGFSVDISYRGIAFNVKFNDSFRIHNPKRNVSHVEEYSELIVTSEALNLDVALLLNLSLEIRKLFSFLFFFRCNQTSFELYSVNDEPFPVYSYTIPLNENNPVHLTNYLLKYRDMVKYDLVDVAFKNYFHELESNNFSE